MVPSAVRKEPRRVTPNGVCRNTVIRIIIKNLEGSQGTEHLLQNSRR